MANPITAFHRFQFAAPLCYGVDAQPGNACKLAVTAMPELLGFQTNIESLLPFIQGADQEIHLLM